MKKIEAAQLDEVVYSEILPNGLTVYIIPKKGYSKTYAMFSTKYGSIDRTFIPRGKTERVTVPDGIAHFLEHKLFEEEHGDAMDTFSEQSASVNAFTSATRTAYLFSATDQIEKNIETLLDFVQNPYFTEQTVEKEKGIIAQEIQMYDDSADWRLYLGALEALYEHHPIRIDIAGTIDSINQITAEHLYMCYETFYHPSNMVFSVVGPVDPEQTMNLIRQNQAAKTFTPYVPIQRFIEREDGAAFHHYKKETMDVIKPKVNIVRKSNVGELEGQDYVRHDLALSIGLDTLFSTSSPFYEKLYETEVIDESFGYHFTLERSFNFVSISTDTYEEEKFINEVERQLAQIQLNDDEVERIIRRRLGHFVRALNSPEFIANQFTQYAFAGASLFDVYDILQTLTVEDVEKALNTIVDVKQQSVFVIEPKEEDV